MKISHLILTFALITYCLAQEEEIDECQQWFDQQLEKYCIAADSTSCKFNVGDKKCSKQILVKRQMEMLIYVRN